MSPHKQRSAQLATAHLGAGQKVPLFHHRKYPLHLYRTATLARSCGRETASSTENDLCPGPGERPWWRRTCRNGARYLTRRDLRRGASGLSVRGRGGLQDIRCLYPAQKRDAPGRTVRTQARPARETGASRGIFHRRRLPHPRCNSPPLRELTGRITYCRPAAASRPPFFLHPLFPLCYC
jgi:hypothetical protein